MGKVIGCSLIIIGYIMLVFFLTPQIAMILVALLLMTLGGALIGGEL